MLKQSLTGLLLLLLGLNSQPIQTAPVSKTFTASLVEPSCTISLDQSGRIQLGSLDGIGLNYITRGDGNIRGIGDSGATNFSISLTNCAHQMSSGNEQGAKLTMKVSGPVTYHTYGLDNAYVFKDNGEDGGTSNGAGVVLYIGRVGQQDWLNLIMNQKEWDLSKIDPRFMKKEGNKTTISMFAFVGCSSWDKCKDLNNTGELKAGTLRATVKFEFFYR